jgi:deoxycytidine triphosphate deaminase/cell division protein FtsB
MSRFAQTDDEADNRYKEFKLKDPFPDIPHTLLNFVEIKKYVEETGMIHPFHPEENNFKQASYAVKILGRCIYWDEKGRKQDRIINAKDEFPLKRNSIAFVTLEPRFRIPYYIALRFNLKITQIYRGILLGTGPLVDPGFNAKLCIPLHNLTNNDYVLRGGDDLIWVEFTKISTKYLSNNKDVICEGKPFVIDKFVEFRTDKNILDVNDYLHKAFHGNPIRSSLSEIRQTAENAKKNTRVVTIGGIITLIFLIATILFPVLGLVSDSTNYVKDAKKDFVESQKGQTAEIDKLKEEIQSLKVLVKDLQKNLPRKPVESNIPKKRTPPQDEPTTR